MLIPTQASTLSGAAVAFRELRTRVRGWRSMATLCLCMLALAGVAIWFLWQQSGPTASQSSSVGIQLFQVLAAFQLFLVLIISPASTATAVSGERQRQTWDLLLVTRLSAGGIVLGKLVAGLAFSLLLLFSTLPLFGLVFLFGGVGAEDIAHLYVVFLSTVLLMGTMGLLVSVLTARPAASMIASNLIALALGIGLTIVALYVENWGAQQLTFGSRSVSLTPLPTITHIDPFVALASALPTGNGSTLLGNAAMSHHPFGLAATLPLWGEFALFAVFASLVMAALAALFVRSTSRGFLGGTS